MQLRVNDVFVLDDSVLDFLAGLWGGARSVTKPLAGCAGARIVGTIGGTAQPAPIVSALSGVARSAGVGTHFCILLGGSP